MFKDQFDVISDLYDLEDVPTREPRKYPQCRMCKEPGTNNCYGSCCQGSLDPYCAEHLLANHG